MWTFSFCVSPTPGLNAYDVLQSGMRPWEVMYQDCSEKTKARTGDVFPEKVLPWEPNKEIKDYFEVNADRLRSLLLRGSDPRPGNISFYASCFCTKSSSLVIF